MLQPDRCASASQLYNDSPFCGIVVLIWYITAKHFTNQQPSYFLYLKSPEDKKKINTQFKILPSHPWPVHMMCHCNCSIRTVCAPRPDVQLATEATTKPTTRSVFVAGKGKQSDQQKAQSADHKGKFLWMQDALMCLPRCPWAAMPRRHPARLIVCIFCFTWAHAVYF